MGAFDFIFARSSRSTETNLIESIFPLKLQAETFIRSDILHTYMKILTDTVERTHGIKESYESVLWDNCLQSESNRGLVSLLAEAMTKKQDLYLVYKASVNVLRLATPTEQAQIREDYKKQSKSNVGIFVSFKEYLRTDMLRIYSDFEYCVLSSLNKTLNLSKAVQLKVNDLRASVSLADSAVAVGQAKSIAAALRAGDDVLLDKNDEISTASPDTSSTEKAISFLDSKRAFVLGLPIAYVTGLQTPGIGSTGEADARAVERGLKQYFVSIIKPVIKALFGDDVEFRTQDFRQMTTALEVLKTFELTSDENLSKFSKQEILARVFDLDPEQEAKLLAEEERARGREIREVTPPVFNPPENIET